MARRHLLLASLAALGLIAVAGGPNSASAAEPRHYRAYGKQTPAQLNAAPTRQRAVSTAVGVGGDALAVATNQDLALQDNTALRGRRGPAQQFNRSPTVQTAVSAAVSVGGNSAALASNNGAELQNNTGLGATRPVPLLELGRAPSTSTAVGTAVSIGGVPIRTER